MIYLNNKLINFDNPLPEHANIAKEYQETITDLRNRFKTHITLKSRKKPRKDPITKLIEPVPNATIPLHITIVGENGREEWLYCDTIPEIKDGVVMPETKQKIVSHGELMISINEDPDFAYFLLRKHGMIQRGSYKLEDHEAEETVKAGQRRKETLLTSVIYGENSHLNIDINFLRLVSKRWGIGNADSMGKDTLQNTLYDKVVASNASKVGQKEGRSIDDFINDVKSSNTDGSLQIAGKIRDAIDQNILIFDPINKRWQINYQDGSYKDVLSVSIADLHQKEEVLILYLQSDNQTYALLLGAMGGETKVVEDNIDKEIVVKTQDISILRKYAKSLGINAYQKSKAALRDEVLDRLAEPVTT